jgi:hypothetical protein
MENYPIVSRKSAKKDTNAVFFATKKDFFATKFFELIS